MIFQNFTLFRKARRFKKSVRLSAAEHAAIKSELYAYMKRVPALPSARLSGMNSANIFGYPLARVGTSALSALLMTALLGGSVSYAAEDTLPGDTLYPVKVSVTEPLRESVMVTDEARAAWAFERANRRLAEAATLATRNELDDETSEDIQVRFQKNSREGQEYVARLQAQGKLNVTGELLARFEGSLRGHGRILHDPDEGSFDDNTDIEDAGNDDPIATLAAPEISSAPAPVAPIKSAVAAKRVSPKARMAIEIRKDIENIRAARSKIERRIEAQHNGQYKQDAEDARNAAQEGVSRVLQRVSDKNEERTVQRGEEKQLDDLDGSDDLRGDISEAEEALSEGKASLEEENYGPALIRFHNALRISTEVETHIEDGER